MTDLTERLLNTILIIAGILSAGLGLKGFLVPNGFIDGGVTGTSMFTYFAASNMVDFTIHGIDEYSGITIISKHSDAIRRLIIEKNGRGVTIFAGRGGRDDAEQDILFCVVTRFEIPKIKRTIDQIDRKAFVTVQHLTGISGGIVHNPLARVFRSIDESIAPDRDFDENTRDS